LFFILDALKLNSYIFENSLMSIEVLFNQLTDNAYATYSGEITPWTIQDMDRYYVARQDTQEVAHATYNRRKMHHVAYPVTALDDLQIQRDPLYADKNSQAISIFKELLKELPSAEVEPTLFVLLNIYRDQLRTAQPESDMRDVCLRIDMINRYLAINFIKAIESHAVDVAEVGATLTQLGALTSELFPWVSVGLRKRLFNLPSGTNVEPVLQSAMVFYSALDDTPHVEGLFEAIGIGSTKPAMKQALQQERLVWESMSDTKNIEEKLNHWVRYLKGAVLSRLVVSKINTSIRRMFPLLYADKQKKRAVLVLDMLVERVRREPYLLLDGESLFVAKDSFLPLSADVFYGMLDADYDTTLALVQDYAETAPDVLKEIMFSIFSDKAYTARHEALLEERPYPALTEAQALLSKLNEQVAPLKTSIQEVKASLQQHDKIAQDYNSGWWRWIGSVLGYDARESQEQLEHVTQLADLLNRHDLRTLKGCQAVRTEIQDAVLNQAFKRSFWKSSPYHDALVALSYKLDGLEAKIKAHDVLQVEEVVPAVSTGAAIHASRAVNKSTFTYGSSLIKTMFGSCLGCCDEVDDVDHEQQQQRRNQY
jgi:hypothetical protein